MPSNVSLIRRMMVIFYDLMLLFSLLFSIGLVLVIVVNTLELSNIGKPNALFFFIITIPVSFFYFYISWRISGQTLGMRAWGVKIINFNDKPFTRMQLFIRFIVAIIGFFVFGIGFLYQIFDKNNHSLHDAISQTYLIRYKA